MDWKLVVSVAIPVVVGALSGHLTRNEAQSAWYRDLSKPSWNPPGYVFGPVWAVLYVLMGIAFWRVWKAGGGEHPMGLYAAQLVLNFAWSLLFFRARSIKWALLDILALLGVLVATVCSFYSVDPVAGYLLVPYLAWVSFATALTANLYVMNPR